MRRILAVLAACGILIQSAFPAHRLTMWKKRHLVVPTRR